MRMNFRTKPRIKATIQRDAALAGLDDSAFTMQAAYQAARAVIQAPPPGVEGSLSAASTHGLVALSHRFSV